jgi:transposase-like protein
MSGLKKNFQRRKYDHFSEEDKRMIIDDYLQSGLTKRAIWHKYTGQSTDHGLILYWMYKYGYFSEYKKKSVTFAPKIENMSVQQQEPVSDFETLQLKKRILELEKQLQESEMKTIAWQTMVEIAEREFNISIKKKFNTKPLKR